MESTSIIIKPLITEKGTRLQETGNSYSFEVARGANKHQIKDAVEKIYDVKVSSVRTMNRKGKPRRAKARMTTTSAWKRAIVTLDEHSKIEVL